MLAATRQPVNQDLWIEIRSRCAQAPTLAEDLHRLDLCLLEKSRLFVLSGRDVPPEPHYLAALFDPLVEVVSAGGPEVLAESPCVDVFCRPGVTDAEGDMAALALSCAGLSDVTCRAGLRYRFPDIVPLDLRPAVERLLGNPLIHCFLWSDELTDAADLLHPPAEEQEAGSVLTVDLPDDAEALLSIGERHQLALDLGEMRAIASYFREMGRSPTDVELQSLALTWSEHCSHKTFKATIHFAHDGRVEVIPGLLQTCLAAPTAALNRPWVRSAFVDNAGVIAFDRDHDLAFKVETHNHPAALEPYGGAHTGVGGVIRDILAVSAEPIANTDVLCFGPPDLPDCAVPAGMFHPRVTYREVVRGVADYGNNMGIPTVGGAIVFHPGYTANPLVYCGTLGLAPVGSHPSEPKPGDVVVLLGGRTGRDGLHGATMSSASLDRERVASSTVQIGAPITEKTVRDVLPRLRNERLYHAITDCGAGGLCSAVGEMGAELGVEIDLAHVPLKYEGLRPWEIWLSEAQERMVLAVPPPSLPRLFELCRAHDVEATALGRFRDDGALQIRYQGRPVADMEMRFLHGGRPARVLQARWTSPSESSHVARGLRHGHGGTELQVPALQQHPGDMGPCEAEEALLRLLAHPTIASKEEVIRRYDHEVGAATVVKPLVGRSGPSDAAVLRPLPADESGPYWRGVVVAHGINPLFGALDPHAMAMLAVDEALRNLVAVGGSIDRAALLDNFCWGDVDDPDELGGLVRAAQGCRDAALAYRVPFISGKDSLRNTTLGGEGRRSIPGTLLISAVGVVPDARRTATMDLKAPGSGLYLLGLTADEMGGSHYLWGLGGEPNGRVPAARPRETRKIMRRLTRAIRSGLVSSCHDLSEGGLAVAAAEMAIAGGLGLELDLDRVPGTTSDPESLLFAESSGRFLAEVAPENRPAFERLFGGLPCGCIGEVSTRLRLVVRCAGDMVIDLSLDEIESAWREPLTSSGPGRVYAIHPAGITEGGGREQGDEG